MNINFQIHYRAEYGQSLCVIETQESILGWTEREPLVLNCQGTDFWSVNVPVSDFAGTIHYKYAIRLQDGGFIYEAGEPRVLVLKAADKRIVVRDAWQASTYEDSFYTTAFLKALFKRQKPAKAKAPKGAIRFSIDLPQILPTQGVAIIGNCDALGNWNTDDKLIMSDAEFPVWRADIDVKGQDIVEYKYMVYDLKTGAAVDVEWGENRQIWGVETGQIIYQNDRGFRRTQPRWKGAGVAVPVFSLRTEEGFGIGEFQDLKKLAEWAAATGQKMIQTLPINDTTLVHTNEDSYPYNAVSVFALHPIYINIEQMGRLTPAMKKKYEAKKAELNALTIADYQNVYDAKMVFFKALYKQDKDALFGSEEYKAFEAKIDEKSIPLHDLHHQQVSQAISLFAEKDEDSKAITMKVNVAQGPNEKRAIAYLDACLHIDNLTDEESGLIRLAKRAITTGKFQQLQRDINKLQSATKKTPVKPAIQIEKVIAIISSYPLQNISTDTPLPTLSVNKVQKGNSPEIIISESFNS